ncbi:MAG TPA: hypothetical protein VGH38_22125 [Bryobacteraceae bacterium]|jgi:hypothetical protein
MSSQTRKLSVIHARTDHDLLVLINRELDRAFALLDAAASRNSPLFTQAERSSATAKQLLPRICHLSEDDRVRVETRLKDLRARLERAPGVSKLQSFPAAFAS